MPGVSAAKATPSPRGAVDLLMQLGRCPDRTVFCVIFVVRMCFLGYMMCCRRLIPFLMGVPSAKMTVFDTSSTSDPTDAFPEVTRWDVVHFYHIAMYGYTHETNFAFYPFMPMLIRATTYVVNVLCPLLGAIASAPAYLCLLNVTASATAGVLLRRITTLTFVGKEGLLLQRHSRLTPLRLCSQLFGPRTSSQNEKDKEEEEEEGEANAREGKSIVAALARLLELRWRRQATGTPLDRLRLQLEDTANDTEARLVYRRWRFVGATALAWLLTPSMVFTVALYTESLFALFTFSGIYSQIRLTRAEAQELVRIAAAGEEEDRDDSVLVPDDVVKSLQVPSDDGACLYQFRQQWWPSCRDIISFLAFLATASIRSNGFVNVGFLWYPIVLHVLWPVESHARWKVQYAPLCHRLRTRKSETHNNNNSHNSQAVKAATVTPPKVITVRLPTLPTRWPHPVRLVWLCLYTAVLLVPSTAMNYAAYTRFHPLMSPAEQRELGSHFWRMYAHIQAKYWDCGPFHAYSIKNSPNVLIALPVGSLIVATSVLICRSFHQGYPRAKVETRHGGDVLARLVHCLHIGLQSSNLTLLWVLALIAFTVMHIQVVNRFIMTCPALHWLFAYWWTRWSPQATSLRRVLKHRHTNAGALGLYGPMISFMLLAYMILWNILGGYMFPNHLPWT